MWTPTTAPLEADEIILHLWQGSIPRRGRFVADHGFDTLVFCADEHQPGKSFPPDAYEDIEIIAAPNYDDSSRPPTQAELAVARRAAEVVAERVREEKNVLVTCMSGWNRSGLVVALALTILKGWSGEYATSFVKSRRFVALRNPRFVEALSKIPGTAEGPKPEAKFLLPSLGGDFEDEYGRIEDEPG